MATLWLEARMWTWSWDTWLAFEVFWAALWSHILTNPALFYVCQQGAGITRFLVHWVMESFNIEANPGLKLHLKRPIPFRKTTLTYQTHSPKKLWSKAILFKSRGKTFSKFNLLGCQLSLKTILDRSADFKEWITCTSLLLLSLRLTSKLKFADLYP